MSRRLEVLEGVKYLDNRIFKRISENMSYEIFKYINSGDLLEIRSLTLGGYQITSSTLLRGRIKNYLKFKPFVNIPRLLANERKLNITIQQGGEKNFLKCIRFAGVKLLAENLRFTPNLRNLHLG